MKSRLPPARALPLESFVGSDIHHHCCLVPQLCAQLPFGKDQGPLHVQDAACALGDAHWKLLRLGVEAWRRHLPYANGSKCFLGCGGEVRIRGRWWEVSAARMCFCRQLHAQLGIRGPHTCPRSAALSCLLTRACCHLLSHSSPSPTSVMRLLGLLTWAWWDSAVHSLLSHCLWEAVRSLSIALLSFTPPSFSEKCWHEGTLCSGGLVPPGLGTARLYFDLSLWFSLNRTY